MDSKLGIWVKIIIIGFLIGIGGVWVGFTIAQTIFIGTIVCALVGYFEGKN